jgi:putative heme-binding domain-containing protein
MHPRAGARWPIVAPAAMAVAIVARVAAQNPAPAGVGSDYADADIAYGASLYAAQCSTCHSPTGDGVGGVDLRSGKFRNATTDQDLTRVITTGIQGTGMLGFKLTPPEVTGIVAYLRNMNRVDPAAVKSGDAVRGRAVFESRECLRCHRVEGRGSRVAPDLSEIGAVRSAGSLQRSLVDPTSQMMPINRPVRAVTKDGKTIAGRRLNEDTYTVQLLDDQERLVSLSKTDLRELTILTTSPMPSYKSRLSDSELADLLAYLLSLRGQQP